MMTGYPATLANVVLGITTNVLPSYVGAELLAVSAAWRRYRMNSSVKLLAALRCVPLEGQNLGRKSPHG